MFADVKADFEDRVREVDLYFQLLAAMDNDEVVIGIGKGLPQIVPPGPHPPDWGRMLKGASNLVLYNLVEAFVRRGFEALFDAIKGDGLTGIQLIKLLREQWVQQKNRKVKAFDGSPKVYMEIANDIMEEIADGKAAFLTKQHLPISGNLDADTIREVCSAHGVDASTPKGCKGGSALTTVRKKRNSLSHGDESFVEVGRTLTAADLIRAKDEIVLFIRSIIANMETFATAKGYKK